MTLESKDIGIRKSEFVAKSQFLFSKISSFLFMKYLTVIRVKLVSYYCNAFYKIILRFNCKRTKGNIIEFFTLIIKLEKLPGAKGFVYYIRFHIFYRILPAQRQVMPTFFICLGTKYQPKTEKKTFLLSKPKSELSRKKILKFFLISEWFIKFLHKKVKKKINSGLLKKFSRSLRNDLDSDLDLD